MQKIMASPEVIDGGTRPEDMYSPSKNAQCCGLSTECIVCMHTHTHTKLTGQLHIHIANTVLMWTHNRFFCAHISFSLDLSCTYTLGKVCSHVVVNIEQTHGRNIASDLSVWLNLTPIADPLLPSLQLISKSQAHFTLRIYIFVILMCHPVAMFQSIPLLGCLKFVCAECP